MSEGLHDRARRNSTVTTSSFSLWTRETEENLAWIGKTYTIFSLLLLAVDTLQADNVAHYIIFRSIDGCWVTWRNFKAYFWIRFDSWQKTVADLFHVNWPTALRSIRDSAAHLYTKTPMGHFGVSLFWSIHCYTYFFVLDFYLKQAYTFALWTSSCVTHHLGLNGRRTG